MSQSRFFTRLVRSLVLTGAASCVTTFSASSKTDGVQISQLDGKLRIEIGGELFAEYFYQDVSRPFLYPIIGPDGLPTTRNWPMKEAENEEHDHPHHRSFWYAHGDINGHDFWSEGAKAGKTVHEQFTEMKSGPDAGVIRSRNKLVANDGTVVCTDERSLRIYNRKDERLFDFEITIHASNGELTLGDTKEGTMAMRLAETMRLKGKVGKGHIVNSEGVRDYGLFAANAFGWHDFEKKPEHAGDMKIKAGESATFRYRFYIHRGDEKEGKVAERYDEYVKQRKS